MLCVVVVVVVVVVVLREVQLLSSQVRQRAHWCFVSFCFVLFVDLFLFCFVIEIECWISLHNLSCYNISNLTTFVVIYRSLFYKLS